MSHRGRRLLEEADALSFLLFNCAVMFLGAFFVGMIPLMVDLDPGKVRLMGIFSAGLMLGCALAVIVPEGAEAFFEAREEMGEDVAPTSLVGGALIAGFLGMVILESASSCVPNATVKSTHDRNEGDAVPGRYHRVRHHSSLDALTLNRPLHRLTPRVLAGRRRTARATT